MLLAAAVFAFCGIVTTGIYLFTAQPVTLVIEGVRRDTRTHQSTVGGLFAELGLLIEPGDRIEPASEVSIERGMQITIDKAQPVLIENDGQRRRVYTHLIQPLDILVEAGITLAAEDRLFVDGAPLVTGLYVVPPESIRVVRARRIEIADGDQRRTLHTAAPNVAEALAEANIPLYVADVILPPLGTPLSDGLTIRVERSVPLSVLVDGQTVTIRVITGVSVREALASAGIAPLGLDYTVPAETMLVEAGTTIRLVRVTETDEIVQREIAFERVNQADFGLPPHIERVIQPGLVGVEEIRVRVRLEDGVAVSRSAPRLVVLREPRPEIVAVGPTPSPLRTETPVPGQ